MKKINLVTPLAILTIAFITIIMNAQLKLSGDEVTYIRKALDPTFEDSIFLPGFSYILYLLEILAGDTISMRAGIAILNFSILLLCIKNTDLKALKALWLIPLISPTYLYLMTSFWADSFSALLLSYLMMRIKKSQINILITILLSFLTIIRPQYLIISPMILIINWSKLPTSIRKKIFLIILVITPSLTLSSLNYRAHSFFFPLTSPLSAQLYHHGEQEFIDLVTNKFSKYNFRTTEAYIIETASNLGISTFEAKLLLEKRFASAPSSLSADIYQNLETFFWSGRHQFLDRYITLQCANKDLDHCYFKQQETLLRGIETTIRVLFLLAIAYLLLKSLRFSAHSRQGLATFFLVFSVTTLAHVAGGNPTHGRYVFQLYPILVATVCTISIRRRKSN